jgi:hypothetical protein
LLHPELHLEMSQTVLLIWATQLSGAIAAALHFLGWSLVLLGWVGWTTGRLPRLLSGLYWVVGAAAIFAYLLPDIGVDVLLGLVVSIWQGILLWQAKPEEGQPVGTSGRLP